jgi:tRNA(Ile)-lysidine synthase
MSDLQEQFNTAFEALRPGPTLVVGVSGGMDSMALLELLLNSGGEIILAHFNHQLRGAESDGDEAFVCDEAFKRGLEFRAGRGDVRAAAKGISIEMAARNLRHAFLAKVAQEVGGDIVLAHHADDQIELVLLRAGRGVEGYGAGGIRSESPSPADPRVRILRPLLGFRKSELKEFVESKKIPFREDSSNAELNAERNRIRHTLIPVLREYFGSGFETGVLEEVANVQKNRDATRQLARAWVDGDFAALPDALKMEIILVQLNRAHLPANRRILLSLLKDPTKPVTLRPGQTVTLDARGKLRIDDPLPLPLPMIVQLESAEEKRVDFAGGILTWNFSTRANFQPSEDRMVFDAARVGSFAMLRHPNRGDRVRLSGRSSARPLMDVLSRNKVPREKRQRVVVANNKDGEIFWVEGLRITEDFKVTDKTTKTLEWNWRNFSTGS